ncbi:5-hydroxytryptamine receptor 1D-like [Mya arenaria]|uniref:5-hydroxytryptamine receptor 1D-like n=1 Tax=Mya arenaria TaxID=6604 RepID=UPI0022E1D602|nr:5-hydroxytryptamine receptor 1D-like [Mya arenaria]XP_052809121.1 5-hydroxytryptamine receptor 1D-like [Mya arenaria]XP_052809184.1 5-hydroxytryptamine receptor 1D-like [Mya arenaria]XP_052809240.1 5-hydroxytryptamine receptor 1D-like [Mya arenaria]XP_052809303.1 5-hydroxytryptamine receptor 1D-like [Mya arenaria]
MEIEKVAPLSTSTSNSWALNEVHGPMTYTRVDRISKDAFSTEWVNSTPLGFTLSTVLNFTEHMDNLTITVAANQTEGIHDGYTHVPKYDIPVMVVICIILSVLILATIVGNVFVIAAILLERSLQGVSNYLILSLAVTDLLVAVCVMPLSLVNEISVYWYLGSYLCDFWTSMDILCCTASILHLVAIALDRFWGVSNIDYIRRRTKKQILKMVAVVWLVAFSISIPPLFGWKEESNNPEKFGFCIISQNLVYTIFSTVGAFYFPLVLMVFLNFKIYIVARSRIRKKNFIGKSKPVASTFTNADMKTCGRTSSCSDDDYTICNDSMAVTTALNEEMRYSDAANGGGLAPPNNSSYLTVPVVNQSHSRRSNGHVEPNDISCVTNVTDLNDTEMATFQSVVNTGPVQLPLNKTENNNHKHNLFTMKKKRREADRKRKDKLEMKRERKAAKVLGIITGAFIACWLPFFILAVLAPFCGQHCNIPNDLFSFCLWLGYFNSALNPILYTIFNPSFRKAFHKIIYGKYRLSG